MPVYGDADEYELDQGDILKGASLALPLAGEGHTDGDRRRRTTWVMVTSHGCDCERHERAKKDGQPTATMVLQVAPVVPLDRLDDDGKYNDIRSGRVPRYFHVPAEDGHPERVVDLWQEQPYPTDDLLKLERVGTLAEDWCYRLAIQIFYLRSRKRPEDVFREISDEEE